MKKDDGVKREIFEADQFFMKSGKYEWNPFQLKEAHEDCFERMQQFFASSSEPCEAIVANTFTTNKELKPYIDFADKNGIDVTVFRMENRFKNVHGVPDFAIDKMKTRFKPVTGEITIKDNNI